MYYVNKKTFILDVINRLIAYIYMCVCVCVCVCNYK